MACPTISGPMPSPASTAIFIWITVSRESKMANRVGCDSPFTIYHLREKPRLCLLVLLLERLDLVCMREREPDVVEPVQDAVLAERIDVEAEAFAARRR